MDEHALINLGALFCNTKKSNQKKYTKKLPKPFMK
jgi:hypothetical protein